MSSLFAPIARLSARSLPYLLPADKAEWARAMAREIDETESPGEACLFAFGCAWGALKERIRTMETMIGFGRIMVPAAMLTLGAVTSVSARRLIPLDQAVGLSFVLVAAAFLLGGLLTIWRGPRALVAAAITMIGLHVLVLVWMLAAPGSIPGGPLDPIQRALLTEGLVIWTLLLGAGYFLASPPRVAAAANAMAERRSPGL